MLISILASAERAAEANQSATEREKLTGDPPKTPEEWKEHRAILEALVSARHGRFKIFDETYCGIRPVALPFMSRKDWQVTDRHLRTWMKTLHGYWKCIREGLAPTKISHSTKRIYAFVKHNMVRLNRSLPDFFDGYGELVETYNNNRVLGLSVWEIGWVKRNHQRIKVIPVTIGLNVPQATRDALVLQKLPENSNIDLEEPLPGRKMRRWSHNCRVDYATSGPKVPIPTQDELAEEYFRRRQVRDEVHL